ncbi:MAG: 3-keto-disaccharide hydrolase [Bryobacteraceae bacterium]
MRTILSLAALSTMLPSPVPAADWKRLFNGKDLDGWEKRGDGVWVVLKDGTLVGERRPAFQETVKEWPVTRAQYLAWLDRQAWLYTVQEFEEFDLSLEYWLRARGNSGVSIRDPGRAEFGIISPPDYTRTPSKVAYEIQINNNYPDPNPTGTIYGLAKATPGAQIDDQWNQMVIESRSDAIRVKLNGRLVAGHAGDPKRPKRGPIGLQLHDQTCVVMFRNIQIREIK